MAGVNPSTTYRARQADVEPRGMPPTEPRRVTTRAALAVAVIGAVVGLVAIPVVDASFTASTDASSTFAAAPYFDYSDAVLAASPLGYWPLDDASTAAGAADASGNGQVGSYGGTVTFGAGITRGATRAAEFGPYGEADHVSFPAISLTGSSFSLEVWAQEFDDCCFEQNLFTLEASDSAENVTISYAGTTGARSLSVTVNGVSNFIFAVVAEPYDPHHVVVTYDAVDWEAKVYLDGYEVGSLTAPPLTAATVDPYVSRRPDFGGSGYVTGMMAHAAIYSYALTPSTVEMHHAVGRL